VHIWLPILIEAGFMYMGDTESCCNSKLVFGSEWNQNGKERQKIEVYIKVLNRLRELNVPEAMVSGFDDDLWAHFHLLPTRYTFKHDSLTSNLYIMSKYYQVLAAINKISNFIKKRHKTI
jgi:hypothetical protein